MQLLLSASQSLAGESTRSTVPSLSSTYSQLFYSQLFYSQLHRPVVKHDPVAVPHCRGERAVAED